MRLNLRSKSDKRKHALLRDYFVKHPVITVISYLDFARENPDLHNFAICSNGPNKGKVNISSLKGMRTQLRKEGVL